MDDHAVGIKLKLTNKGLHGKNTHAWIDDVEVTRAISRATVHLDVNGVVWADVRFLVNDLDVETQTVIRDFTLVDRDDEAEIWRSPHDDR